MSKVVFWSILGGLVIIAIAVTNIRVASAGEQEEFIDISVLSDNQADYGVDENPGAIPAVSPEIIQDKLNDEGQDSSSLPVIVFTVKLVLNDPTPPDQGSSDPGQDEQDEPHHDSNGNNGQDNPNGGGPDNPNKGGNQNQNQNNNGSNGSDPSSNNGQEKEKESNPGSTPGKEAGSSSN
ncbi:MAG: hypothetical protein WCC12_20705 [Anaerolineales bacterium]